MLEGTRSIVVIDHDPSVYQTVFGAREAFQYPVLWCSSAEEYLAEHAGQSPECIMVSMELPGMSGLELFLELKRRGSEVPVVMMSRHASIRMVVEAMELGVVTFVEKPTPFNDLVVSIRKALRYAEEQRNRTRHRDSARERLARLTPKEREVFDLIVSGLTNKEMASQLHLSVRAIEDRRARLKRKLGVATPAELGRLARDAQS